MIPLPEHKDISIRTGLSVRRKIDRESDKDDSNTHGLVSVYGSEHVKIQLLHLPVVISDDPGDMTKCSGNQKNRPERVVVSSSDM